MSETPLILDPMPGKLAHGRIETRPKKSNLENKNEIKSPPPPENRYDFIKGKKENIDEKGDKEKRIKDKDSQESNIIKIIDEIKKERREKNLKKASVPKE